MVQWSVFQVMQKKTKYEVQNRFSKLGENEKQKRKFKSVFQCHAKTKNGYGTWVPFSHAIEKRLALRYTHSEDFNWLGWCRDPSFKSCKNDKRNSDLFFNNKPYKNEIHIRFVFQSDAKTKNEIRSSNPFFKVRRKRKTKSKIQICFSKSCENEKWTWNLNSIFPCHRKTVGSKVHAFKIIHRSFFLQ